MDASFDASSCECEIFSRSTTNLDGGVIADADCRGNPDKKSALLEVKTGKKVEC